MKLWEALKIYAETGRQIKPVDQKYYDQDLNWNIANHINSEWEVEPEPKKTVVLYKFACKLRYSIHWEEYDFFSASEEDFRKSHNLSEDYKVKRLDYTATEFEV